MDPDVKTLTWFDRQRNGLRHAMEHVRDQANEDGITDDLDRLLRRVETFLSKTPPARLNNVMDQPEPSVIDADVVVDECRPDPQNHALSIPVREDSSSDGASSSGVPAVASAAAEPFAMTLDKADTILVLSGRGLTQWEIATKMGCDQATVSRCLNKYRDMSVIAKATLLAGSATMAENIVNKGKVEEHIEVLGRMGILPKEQNTPAAVQVMVGLNIAPPRRDSDE